MDLGSETFVSGRGGLLQLPCTSWSPCCRYHPVGGEDRISPFQSPLQPSPITRGLGLRGHIPFRGHLCVRLRYGLGTRRHPNGDAVDGLQDIGFPPPCHPSYRAWTLALAGLSPAGRADLSGHTGYREFLQGPILIFQRFTGCGAMRAITY